MLLYFTSHRKWIAVYISSTNIFFIILTLNFSATTSMASTRTAKQLPKIKISKLPRSWFKFIFIGPCFTSFTFKYLGSMYFVVKKPIIPFSANLSSLRSKVLIRNDDLGNAQHACDVKRYSLSTRKLYSLKWSLFDDKTSSMLPRTAPLKFGSKVFFWYASISESAIVFPLEAVIFYEKKIFSLSKQ